jgi:RHS repeat-associated protein
MNFLYAAYGFGTASGKHARSGYTGACIESGTGAYALGRRLYSPVLRRFLNPDPVSPFGAGGLNRYAYCSGDPINRIDPGGKTWQAWMSSLTGLPAPKIRTDIAAIGLPHSQVASTTMNESLSPTLLASATSAVTDTLVPQVTLSSIASRATEDPKAAGLFGWSSLASGQAPGDITSLDNVPLGSIRVEERPGYRKTTHTFSGYDHQIDNYEGRDAVLEQAPSRMSASGVTTEWHSIRNGTRGINYAVDSEITLLDVYPLMRSIGRSTDTRPITILAGAHGSSDRVNWANGRRLFADRYLYDYAIGIQPSYASVAGRREDHVAIWNIGDMSNIDFVRASSSNALIVHAYCYGITDRELMVEHNIAWATTYRC